MTAIAVDCRQACQWGRRRIRRSVASAAEEERENNNAKHYKKRVHLLCNPGPGGL